MPKLYQAPIYTDGQLEELEEKDLSFPYSDKYMTYDSQKRQYIPTEALLLKHGISLEEFLETTGSNTAENIQETLEYISDQIYSFAEKKSGSSSDTIKWIIAKGVKLGISPYRFRCMFEEILWKQARFYTNNDDLTKSSGVDMEQKQWLNKGVLYNEDRHIDPKIKTTMLSLGLLWVGSYDDQFNHLVRQNNW